MSSGWGAGASSEFKVEDSWSTKSTKHIKSTASYSYQPRKASRKTHNTRTTSASTTTNSSSNDGGGWGSAAVAQSWDDVWGPETGENKEHDGKIDKKKESSVADLFADETETSTPASTSYSLSTPSTSRSSKGRRQPRTTSRENRNTANVSYSITSTKNSYSNRSGDN